MKLIEQSVEVWEQNDLLEHVARCAHVCYKSDRQSDSVKFCKTLESSGHLSTFRHSTVYLWLSKEAYNIDDPLTLLIKSYQITKFPYAYIAAGNKGYLISVNFQEYAYNGRKSIYDRISMLPKSERLSVDEAFDLASHDYNLFAALRFSVFCICQIAISREFNRKSPNNIDEMSTRYVNVGKDGISFIKPYWWEDENEFKQKRQEVFIKGCNDSEENYNAMLAIKLPYQAARDKLELDAATQVVYTYTLAEWKHIMNLRYYGTTGKPQPDAQNLASKIRDVINQKLIEHNIDYSL